MKNHRDTRSRIVCWMAIAGMLFACVPTARADSLNDVLSAFPADNGLEQHILAKRLMALGPDALQQACSHLEPTGGNDLAIRYALEAATGYVMLPGRERDREVLEQAILAALNNQPHPDVQTFLIERLIRMGTARSEEYLKHKLLDEELCYEALRALQAIDAPGTVPALLAVLPKVSPANQALVLTTLGNLRAQGHTNVLRAYTAKEAMAVRAAALYALAAGGEPAANTALQEALQGPNQPDRDEVFAQYLLYARRLAQEGHTDLAQEILRTLLEGQAYDSPEWVRCSALGSLVEENLVAGADELIHWALQESSAQLRATAIQHADRFASTDATKAWCAALPGANVWARADIVRMLGERGDPAALPAVQGRLDDESELVRLAAIEAVAHLGSEQAVPVLVHRIQNAPVEDVPAIHAALLTLPTALVAKQATDALPDSKAPVQVVLLEILEARHATTNIDVVFTLAQQGNDAVRRQAMKTLGAVAKESELARLTRMVAETPEGALQAAGQKAIVTATTGLDDPAQGAAEVLGVFDKTSSQGKAALLPVLARLGSEESLRAIVRHATGDESDIAQAALRALASWPDTRAAGPQLRLASSDKTPATMQILLLRSCIQTVRQSDIPTGEKLEYYAQAWSTASRPQEKQSILAAVGNAPVWQAILLAARGFDDPDPAVQKATAEAIATVAASEQGDWTAGPTDKLVAAIETANDAIADAERSAAMELAVRTLRQVGPNRLTDQEKALGFELLFNGHDLDGWSRHEHLPGHGVAGKWTVEDSAIVGRQDPPGQGGFLQTAATFRDFEVRMETQVDWPFDSGVFLRVGPDGKSHQVTIDYRPTGQVGSIYCPWTQGRVHDCPEGVDSFRKGEWNDLRIRCVGEPARITVWLNGHVITDFQHTPKTTKGVPTEGTIALQVHPGGEGFDQACARFRAIRVRPLPADELACDPLFNGKDLTGWFGATDECRVEDGSLVSQQGMIRTQEQYDNFILDFEFQLPPAGNNGIGIRAAAQGNPAYDGMEIQVLDNTSAMYAELKPWQYHGSIYGVAPAQRGFLNPTGCWNQQRIIARGPQITVILNGRAITDANIADFITAGTPDGHEHPGLGNPNGHIALLGHNSPVRFRTITVCELPATAGQQ